MWLDSKRIYPSLWTKHHWAIHARWASDDSLSGDWSVSPPPPSALPSSFQPHSIPGAPDCPDPRFTREEAGTRGKTNYSQVHLTCPSLRKDSVQASPAREPMLFPLQHQASYGGRYAAETASAFCRPQPPRPQREIDAVIILKYKIFVHQKTP